MAFSLVTWNVLATSYIRAKYYPRTPARCLDATWRHPAIIARVRSLDADVLCLQEVEPVLFAALRATLEPAGYVGELAQKTEKPDGCATFLRKGCLNVIESRRVAYRDGSGHVAHVVVAHHEEKRVAIVNTHLKWNPPDAPDEQRWSMRQTRELLDLTGGLGCGGEVVCGDLNVTPESDVVGALRTAGFDDPHRALDARTCNSNGAAKVIDYVLVRALHATGRPPRAIDDSTPLPSDDEPSDHIPLEARLGWAPR